MGTSIYGLNYEYTYLNGHSIIFNEQDGKKLTTANLNHVQLKMIQSNRIPHLLSLTIENIDLATRLHYDINSRRKVITYLRDNGTTMSDYYQLFLSIIKALEDSGAYMLNQENFILHTDFIFIGANPADVYLTYLPLKYVSRKTNLTDDLKKLLTDVAGEVEGLQGNEFKSILSYIKNASFSISGLKKLILELISLRSNVNLPHQMNSPSQGANLATNPMTQNQLHAQANNHTEQMESVAVITKKGTGKKRKSKKALPPLASRTKVYLFVAAIFVIGITWKLYEMKPSPNLLYICSGISVFTICCVIIYWKVWRPGVARIELEPLDDTANNKDESTIEPKTQPIFQKQAFQLPPEREVKFANDMHAFVTQNAVAATAMDTTLLANTNEDTVLLEDETNLLLAEAQTEAIPILVKHINGQQTETITITANNFLIGRNAESVNYVEDTVGISRIHAEIIRLDATSYGVKDLGSKNGSKLNGNTMVPYKVYGLSENDEFVLGKVNYTFKWSQSE